jgi:hypothetical protein
LGIKKNLILLYVAERDGEFSSNGVKEKQRKREDEKKE